MGFMDTLGGMMGSMYSQMEPLLEYRKEYENMSDGELKAEYKHLKSQTQSTEVKNRTNILVGVLKERGYGN